MCPDSLERTCAGPSAGSLSASAQAASGANGLTSGEVVVGNGATLTRWTPGGDGLGSLSGGAGELTGVAVDPAGGLYGALFSGRQKHVRPGRVRADGPLGGPLGPREMLGYNPSEMNCHGCAGDPVDTASGTLVESFTDLAVPGRGVPLRFTRAYTSATAGVGTSDATATVIVPNPVPGLPTSSDFVISLPGEGVTPHAGGTDSVEATRFKQALNAAYGAFDDSAIAGQTPERKAVNLTALGAGLLDGLHPDHTIPRRVLAGIHYPQVEEEPTPDPTPDPPPPPRLRALLPTPAGNREINGEKDDELVLVIRGELLKKYPTTVVYAHRAEWRPHPDGTPDPSQERKLADLDPAATEPSEDIVKLPLYEAKAAPDIYFFGFDLNEDEARGESGEQPDDDPGWFFVLKERPGDPRFGLDIDRQGKLQVWNDLAWPDVLTGPPNGAPRYLKLDASTPALTLEKPTDPADAEKEDQYEEDKDILWSAQIGAGDLAYILYQAPVLVAVHAREMLGDG